MKKTLYRTIKVRENGALIAVMAMSAATVKRYMAAGFTLFLDANGQPVLSR